MEMQGLHKEIELTGDYKTHGKLFRVPINSKGTLLFILRNMDATHTVQFKPKKERGHIFMDMEINFKINHVDMFKMDLYNPSTTRLAGRIRRDGRPFTKSNISYAYKQKQKAKKAREEKTRQQRTRVAEVHTSPEAGPSVRKVNRRTSNRTHIVCRLYSDTERF